MALTPNTLINGIAYSFVDISFSISGIKSLPGFNGIPIKSLSYNATQQKTANYENSKFATSYSYGKKTYTGNVGLTADAAEQLRDAVFALKIGDQSMFDRSITSIPAVDVNITFSVKGKANVTVLKNVAFTSENLTGAEGNDTIAVSCDFIASYIDFGTVSPTPIAALLDNQSYI